MKQRKRASAITWLFFIVVVIFGAMLCYYALKSKVQKDNPDTANLAMPASDNADFSIGAKNTNVIPNNIPVNNEGPENKNTDVPPIVIPTTNEEISRIDTAEKIIVFTFDAGGSDASLTNILEALAAHRLTGTFFYDR